MMNDVDEFAVWMSGAVLRASDQPVAAMTIDAIAESAAASDLATALADARRFEKQGGDFGAEIVGPLLVTILIEASKALWAAYLKKMTEKAAGKAVDVTIDTVKAFVRLLWSGDSRESAAAEYESLIRTAAAKQGVPVEEVEAVLAVLRRPRMSDELSAS